MPDLVESIAALTNLRDQGALEKFLASMLFTLVKAENLRLWGVSRRNGETLVAERILLPGASRIANTKALPLDQVDAGLRQCFEHKTYLQSEDPHGMFRSLFPAENGREVIGLLEIFRARALVPAEQRMIFGLLRIYCNHLGVLTYGDHDELTGLLNRRTFGDCFKRVVAPDAAGDGQQDRRRNESAFAQVHLAVIDIDFFKRINDTFGHPYGDEVLVLLARLMRQSFRDTDIIFRFGGEEFIVVLPGTAFDEAERALERFRGEVEHFNFAQVGRVTVSIGFTALCTADTGPDAFGRADQALYVAKHGGRNQVQSYELLVASGALASAAAENHEVELF